MRTTANSNGQLHVVIITRPLILVVKFASATARRRYTHSTYNVRLSRGYVTKQLYPLLHSVICLLPVVCHTRDLTFEYDI